MVVAVYEMTEVLQATVSEEGSAALMVAI